MTLLTNFLNPRKLKTKTNNGYLVIGFEFRTNVKLNTEEIGKKHARSLSAIHQKYFLTWRWLSVYDLRKY